MLEVLYLKLSQGVMYNIPAYGIGCDCLHEYVSLCQIKERIVAITRTNCSGTSSDTKAAQDYPTTLLQQIMHKR